MLDGCPAMPCPRPSVDPSEISDDAKILIGQPHRHREGESTRRLAKVARRVRFARGAIRGKNAGELFPEPIRPKTAKADTDTLDAYNSDPEQSLSFPVVVDGSRTIADILDAACDHRCAADSASMFMNSRLQPID